MNAEFDTVALGLIRDEEALFGRLVVARQTCYYFTVKGHMVEMLDLDDPPSLVRYTRDVSRFKERRDLLVKHLPVVVMKHCPHVQHVFHGGELVYGTHND